MCHIYSSLFFKQLREFHLTGAGTCVTHFPVHAVSQYGHVPQLRSHLGALLAPFPLVLKTLLGFLSKSVCWPGFSVMQVESRFMFLRLSLLLLALAVPLSCAEACLYMMCCGVVSCLFLMALWMFLVSFYDRQLPAAFHKFLYPDSYLFFLSKCRDGIVVQLWPGCRCSEPVFRPGRAAVCDLSLLRSLGWTYGLEVDFLACSRF